MMKRKEKKNEGGVSGLKRLRREDVIGRIWRRRIDEYALKEKNEADIDIMIPQEENIRKILKQT